MDPNDQAKWVFLRDVPARDAQTEEMRYLAGLLIKIAAVSPWPRWAFAQLALSVSRDLILYVSDITRLGREQIDGLTDPQGSALASLERGTDDCDAKARLFVALCLAAGMRAEMVPRWKHGHLQHVSAAVLLQGPSQNKPDWWPVETILDRSRLGDVAEAVPTEIGSNPPHWAQTGLLQRTG